MKNLSALFVIAFAAFFAGCSQQSSNDPATTEVSSGDDTTSPTAVTLMLNWFPEAEHGGYYAALVHGYFEEEGLEVTIDKGGPNAPVIQRVARGDIEFGITNADRVILARVQDAKLKALFAPLANSPRCLIVHADSGITEFEQLANVTLMLRRENAWAQYLIKKLPLKGVDIVPNTGSLAPFLADKNAVKQGYIISEPFVAKSQGAEVDSLLVADFGFNPYTSVLMTRDEYAAERPDIVRKMVAASRRGWQKYLESPAETNAHIHELNPEMSLDVLAYGVEAIKSHCVDDNQAPEAFGAMQPARWSELVSQLEDLEMIESRAVDPAALHTSEFLLAK